MPPNIQLVTGKQPKTLGELKPIMEYVEEELGQLLATIHAGQEGAAIDYDNKSMHGRILDHVGMEVSDIAQVTALGFPKSDPEAPLVEIGMGYTLMPQSQSSLQSGTTSQVSPTSWTTWKRTT